MRIAALCFSALCLVLNAPAQTAGASEPEPTSGSLAKRTCEARALPLPKVRLVKDVLEAMPDKCDERLFGTWYCGISCLYDDCEADHGIYTLRRSIDPDGYERIHKSFSTGGDPYLSEWRVDRKWGASASNHWMETGKLVAASCNGKTDAGYSNLSVNLKNPDGSDRKLIKYWVDGVNQTMWVEHYDVRWEGDKAHKKFAGSSECRRELKPYR